MSMDNDTQISEIEKYHKFLTGLMGRDIDKNTAARIWIRKYAELWRIKHPTQQTIEQSS